MPTFDSNQINTYLQNFRSNPIETMKQAPAKLDPSGQAIDTGLFTAEDQQTAAYHESRDQLRQHMLQQAGTSRAAMAANDDPRNLVDVFKYDNLPAIHEANLRSAQLAAQPWSGDYWATANGGLGSRYADYNSFKEGWDKTYEYTRTHPSKVILNSGSETWVNELSPAEKYDALVGDAKETLTQRSWLTGKEYFDQHQEVPGWFGICHGWAPASFMMPRPVNSIKLLTPSNLAITFYPCEIKALCSLLWAQAAPKSRFIGGRCNAEKVSFDPETGRTITLYNPYLNEELTSEFPPEEGQPRPGEVEVTLSSTHYDDEGNESRTGGRSTEGQCFDSNPGAWHLTVVNQIGVSKRSMVMDATFDAQVWNQPVLGYKYTYFNPQTLQQTEDLAQASISKAAFSSDIFKKYRSPKAASFVGIVMRVSYMAETGSVQDTPDAPEHDAIATADYYYDLEIDAAGKIIGGEWYSNTHPDFLWTPPKGGVAVSRYENLAVGAWDSKQALPENWRAAAIKASTDMTPLAKIVEQMLTLSV